MTLHAKKTMPEISNVTLKALFGQNIYEINISMFIILKIDYFQFSFSTKVTYRNYQNLAGLILEKRQFLPHYYLSIRIQDNFVNRTLPSCMEGHLVLRLRSL